MKIIIFILLMVALSITGSQAQGLQIHKTDGTIISVPLNALDSITFFEGGGTFVCGTSTVSDIDGNVYNTLLIGDQCWMNENLKTTQYRNGTPIENPTGNSDWEYNTTGAYVWHNNEISWKDSYGALYNWHAVNSTNGLCPTGWHVPTIEEYTVITNFLGGTSVAGGIMKSTRTHPDPHPRWESPNTGATNESDWSGLPGSGRDYEGNFYSPGYNGFWWASNEDSAYYAWSRQLDYNSGSISSLSYYKSYGFSVRCLRD